MNVTGRTAAVSSNVLAAASLLKRPLATGSCGKAALSPRPEEGCELPFSAALARGLPCSELRYGNHYPSLCWGVWQYKSLTRGCFANQPESLMHHTLVSSYHEHNPELLPLQHDSISPLPPRSLILSSANSLAWKSRCLPIKPFSAER